MRVEVVCESSVFYFSLFVKSTDVPCVHPLSIRLHDVFIEDHKPSINHICIIMELGCESLRDLLNRSGALPLALMPYIAKQLLTSLQCMIFHF